MLVFFLAKKWEAWEDWLPCFQLGRIHPMGRLDEVVRRRRRKQALSRDLRVKKKEKSTGHGPLV